MQNYRKTSHSIFDIKYHLAWITKYRYPVLKNQVAVRTRELIREIAKSQEVEILAGHVGTDHIHLLVSSPPQLSVSRLVQHLKGKSSRKLLQEFSELRKRYWGQHLWARGFFCVSSGNVTDEMWKEYIENQRLETKEDNFDIAV